MRKRELETFLEESGLPQDVVSRVVHKRFLNLGIGKRRLVDQMVAKLWARTALEDAGLEKPAQYPSWETGDDRQELARYWQHLHDAGPATGARARA